MKDYKVDKESFSDSFRKEVYEVVVQIPAGKVASYGLIARLLEVPQCSRMVGRALKEVPEELDIPCHRVVNGTGHLVPGWERQRELLLAEGVLFKDNGCVDMKHCLWEVE